MLVLLFLPVVGESGQIVIPFTGPILRVESGMHTRLSRRIAVDSAERFIVSVADDKTIRIWGRDDGRLLLTFRVPIGLTEEGSLYAVALSPDGRTLAVSGQTGAEWDGDYCIYLIDVMAGKVRKRILNLPEPVNHLAFSPTGGYLAAVFGQKAGLWVFGIPDGGSVFKSPPYLVVANWVDFAPDGRLVTSSYDGAVRLYDANFRLLRVKQLAKMSKPYGVAFSPDGSKVAVGFRDRPTVVVLSGTDLNLSYLPDVKGVRHNLWVVAWSKDGGSLFAGGGHREKGRSLIRWWSQGGETNSQGQGDYVDVAASGGNVMQIWPLKDGGLVFIGSDPVLGVLDSQGFPVYRKDQAIVSFQGSARRLLVSETGNVVDFSFDLAGQKRGRFSVSNLSLQVNPTTIARVREPRQWSEEIQVAGWWGDAPLTLNGEGLALQEREIAHALALDLKDRFFVIGTSFNLRFYSKIGRMRWKVATSGPVWAVNITGDGQYVVAALGDGTIRWYDVRHGEERMALFIHKDQQHWAAWSTMKFYAASPGGDGLIGWHVNRGANQLADFYPVSQFPAFQKPDYFKHLFR